MTNVIREAADRMLVGGRITGSTYFHGKYCPIGALGASLGLDVSSRLKRDEAYEVVDNSDEGKFLRDFIVRRGFESRSTAACTIYNWNDGLGVKHTPTDEEVLELMYAAADAWDARDAIWDQAQEAFANPR